MLIKLSVNDFSGSGIMASEKSKSLERRNYTIYIDDFRECLNEDFEKMIPEDPDREDLSPVLGTMKRYIDYKLSDAIDKGRVIPGFEDGYRVKMKVTSTDEVKAVMRAFGNVLIAVLDEEEMQRLDEHIIVKDRNGNEKYRFTPKQHLFNTVKKQAKMQIANRRDEYGKVSFIDESSRTIITACDNTVDKNIADYYYKRDLSDYIRLTPEEKIDAANTFYATHKIPYLLYPTDEPLNKCILGERLLERISQYPRKQKLAIYRRLTQKQPELFGLPALKSA